MKFKMKDTVLEVKTMLRIRHSDDVEVTTIL